jgi:hypothetical protein
MKGDLGKSYQCFIESVFPRYRGCDVQHSNGGYICCGRFCANKEELDRAINERHKTLGNSLNRIKSNQ